jgi:hypothetical protein
VVFVFLGSVAFFYLAARTLATHKAWRDKVKQFETELASELKKNQEIVESGFPDANGQPSPGINQLKQQLKQLATNRGGALFDVEVVGVKEGLVELKLKSPDHGLAENSVLFAFDKAKFEEGGRYQGEFKVATVSEDKTTVQLAPILPLGEAEGQRLAAVKGPWTLYTTMPSDETAIFSRLDEKTKAALLPAESLGEYTGADRKLRDYQLLFHENYIQRALIADDISKASNNIERTTADVREAIREGEYRQTEMTHLKSDLEKFKFELEAIAAYQKSLEQLLTQVRDSVRTKYVQNRQMAATLTSDQWKAVDEINQRGQAAAP